MSGARLVLCGRDLFPLGGLPPRQRGAGGVESLSSHIASQAREHNCAPFTLLRDVLIPATDRLSRRWKRVRWTESHLINGYGAVAQGLVESMARLSGLKAVAHMTFVGLDSLCDPVAKHFMHALRPWCPECYMESRKLGIDAWDPLYTYVRTTKVCVRHLRELEFRCACCKLGQRYLSKLPFLDICEHCGADLTHCESKRESSASEIEPALWFARAAMSVIDERTKGRSLNVDDFRENLFQIQKRHFGGKAHRFALSLGLATSSPKNWIDRCSKPTWASLLDLCFRMDIPPHHLGSREASLTDPSYWRSGPPKRLDRPHKRPTKKDLSELRRAIQSRLKKRITIDMPSLEGISRFSKRHGVSPGTLKRHFPNEWILLVAQRRVAERRLAIERAKLRSQRLQSAMNWERKAMRSPTIRNLKKSGKVRVCDVVRARG